MANSIQGVSVRPWKEITINQEDRNLGEVSITVLALEHIKQEDWTDALEVHRLHLTERPLPDEVTEPSACELIRTEHRCSAGQIFWISTDTTSGSTLISL